MKAVAELKKQTNQFKVLIAGDGGLKEELMQLSRQLQITDHVEFIGFIKNVPEFLSALDILAVPSNNEGLGTVILDGILAGCAVIGSRVGGIPEIIENQKTGFLIEVGDHQALAKGLLQFIQNPQLARQLSSEAQKWVRHEFSLESMVEGNDRIYQSVLKT